MFHVKVDPYYCKSCGYCVHFCKRDVLAVGQETNQMGYRYVVAVHPENCIGCKMCVTMCGESAITLQKEEQ